ncbi:MAG: peptidylprolyl isomerase [candidate division Zixibacteria bacterium]|nr:peptidylprolyl isomerase [candidate division Zixibacteria bacterium]
MRKRIAILALVVLGLVSGSGCESKQDQMVAQVGKDKITVGRVANDFVAMKKGSQIQLESNLPLLEQVKQFVDQEIDGKLQIQAAYEKGFDKDPQIISRLDQEKDKLLLNQLFQKEVLSKAKVTDKDVEDFYKKLGERIKVRHILVKTKKEADQIYQTLKGGANFDSLAKEKSIDPGTKEKGGDLGFITWNALLGLGPFKEAAFKLKPNEISHPVKTIAGWHVIKLEERKKEEQKPFAEEKDRLKMSLQMMRQQEAALTYVYDLMEKSDLQMVSPTLKKLEEKARELAAKDTLQTQPQMANIDPGQLTEEERSLPVLKYKGGVLKVDDFLQFYNRLPYYQRPPLTDEDNLKNMVFNYLLAQEFLKKEALKKGIDKSKEYKDRLNQIKEGAMADKFRKEVIWEDLTVDSTEIELFYERNKDKFIAPAQAHVLEIMVKTEEEAQKMLKQLRAGADFKKLAQENTIRTYAKKNGGDLGFIAKSNYPELFDAAFQLKKGQLGGPIHLLQSPVGEGYSVIKLVEKTEQRQKTLKEIEPDMQSGATYEKRNAVYQQWLAQARAKTQIKIDQSGLQAVVKMVEKELPEEKKG